MELVHIAFFHKICRFPAADDAILAWLCHNSATLQNSKTGWLANPD
jgi:hypothetical protein